MTGEQALSRLREHQSELREQGIVRLSLFGSTARGTSERTRISICSRLSMKRAASLCCGSLALSSDFPNFSAGPWI
jgi:hypothetical protein